MFYDNYLNAEEQELIKENYSTSLYNIDNENAILVVDILNKHNCKFINDLIINYLEIFFKKPYIIDTKLSILNQELGEKYMDIIEENLNLLID